MRPLCSLLDDLWSWCSELDPIGDDNDDGFRCRVLCAPNAPVLKMITLALVSTLYCVACREKLTLMIPVIAKPNTQFLIKRVLDSSLYYL